MVNRYSSMGEFHVCKSTFLEVVKTSKDPQKCIHFSSARTNLNPSNAKGETKVFVGKIFLNIADPEILFLLSLKLPPKQGEDSSAAVSQETNSESQTLKNKIGL